MKRANRSVRLMAEINITPFTDVVLVLLIIFMIATPFIYQSSMKVQLPKASKSEETSRDIIITINAQGEVFLEDTKLELEALKYKLRAMMKAKPDTFVIINGDKNVKFCDTSDGRLNPSRCQEPRLRN
mgnify:CR=1 FL=1